jgi:hypothetical protein
MNEDDTTYKRAAFTCRKQQHSSTARQRTSQQDVHTHLRTMSCAACFAGASATGTPTGTTADLHGLQTYTATPTASIPRATIILYTDAFGLRLPNTLLLADALAARTRARVLVPDIIPGGGMAPGVLELTDTVLDAGASALSRAGAIARA